MWSGGILRRIAFIAILFSAVSFGVFPWQAEGAVAPAATPAPIKFAVPIEFKTHYTAALKQWVRFTQCQIKFDVNEDPHNCLSYADNINGKQEARLNSCLRTAIEEHAEVLILPEVSVSLPTDIRQRVFAPFASAARSHKMLIIAGSYYDSDRRSRIAYFGPGWTERGYKIQPSRFEASPEDGHGMLGGKSIVVLRTEFGVIATITCVDLISDAVQADIRRLVDAGQLNVLVNINYNPASWEFLVEANSLARRHPVFVSITNAVPEELKKLSDAVRSKEQRRHGYCLQSKGLS
jgi:hypothetical protein